jgi:glycosyltransferase involved in cell wall biosynthesis
MTSGATDDRRASVSVVIPTHNRPDLVGPAVQSVLDQPETYDVIVVDDGSSPPLAVTGPLADARVRVVRNEAPQGPSAARNRGLDMAHGDYVSFLDDDDRWLAGKLSAGLAALDAHPEAAVVAHRTGYAEPDDAGAPGMATLLADPLVYYGTHQTPHPDSLLVRRAVATDVRFPEDLPAAEDVDYAIQLARHGPFVLLDRVLAVHGPDDVPTAIGMEKRIAARLALKDRHADVLYHDAASRAFYHVRLGHLLRRVSRTRALKSFAQALANDCRNPRAWRGIAATLLPRSVSRRLGTANR